MASLRFATNSSSLDDPPRDVSFVVWGPSTRKSSLGISSVALTTSGIVSKSAFTTLLARDDAARVRLRVGVSEAPVELTVLSSSDWFLIRRLRRSGVVAVSAMIATTDEPPPSRDKMDKAEGAKKPKRG